MLPGFLRRTRVTVEPLVGNRGDGPVYGTPVSYLASVSTSTDVDMRADDRDTGTTFMLDLPAHAQVAVGSRVTVGGRAARVDDVSTSDAPVGGHLRVKVSTA